MPYHFKPSETVTDAVKRIISEEIDSAVEQLKRTGNQRDEAVHEARKSLKKIRGMLRLIQPEVGRGFYKRENGLLRDVGRKLSEIRDAGAIIEVFDDLATRYQKELTPTAQGDVRRGLKKAKAETEKELKIDEVIRETIHALGEARQRLGGLRIDSDGWNTIASGFRKYYRLGRAAMERAGDEKTPEAYHEWRKRAKDHWYHVRLLEKSWDEKAGTYEGSLKELETTLGDDHNLVVLRQRLEKEPNLYGGHDPVQLWLGLIDRRAEELRGESGRIGSGVYCLKPRKREGEFARLWEVWKAENGKTAGPGIPRKSSNSAKIVQPRASRRAS
ncbi:MAG: CHAD domain-containing protein [Acidobacteriaceae bacterium]|nr:CHAD domain-containing protein [Acidobacteriaceae bacterium]